MVVEPGIQVNLVVHAPTAEKHAGDAELIEQGGTDPQIGGSLVFGQAPRRRQRQARVVHHWPLEARS